MAVESIAAGVYQVGPRFVNAFMIDGDEGVTLVDTLLPNKADLITAGLKEIGRSVGDMRAVLITHSHADHSGDAAAVIAHSKCPPLRSRSGRTGNRGR